MANTSAERVQEYLTVVWNERQVHRLNEFWTEDCINHVAPIGRQNGLAALRDSHTAAFTGSSDLRVEILGQITDNNQVATWLKVTGTHDGPFLGLIASNRTFEFQIMRLDRFEDGKIAEHRAVQDLDGLMNQLL